jgi:hypothetical protein
MTPLEWALSSGRWSQALAALYLQARGALRRAAAASARR